MADGQSLAAQLPISTALTTFYVTGTDWDRTAMGIRSRMSMHRLQTARTKLDAAKSSGILQLSANSQVAAANGRIDTANGQIESAKEPLLIQRLQQHRQPCNTDLVNSLTAAKSNHRAYPKWIPPYLQILLAETAVDQVTAPDVETGMPGIDTASLTATLQNMKTSLRLPQSAAGQMSTKLDGMQTKLATLSGVSIPEAPMTQLTTSVKVLNTGMQGLDAAIDTLAGNVKTLKTQTASLPSAGAGIASLLSGFDSLGSYNDQLTSGAKELKQNAPVLNAGVKTLQKGTKQLASGVSQLSTQLSAGASTLVSNNATLTDGSATLLSGVDELFTGAGTLQTASGQVADGISQLADGAKELADGTSEFEEEGTKKLKETVEDDLLTVIDRIKALSSDECTYDTFSGKASGVDSNVKFIIETDPIE